MDTPLESPKAVYVISDGTGETAALMLKAALVQFKHPSLEFFRYRNIRSETQLLSILDNLPIDKGLLAHTIVSDSLRKLLSEEAKKRKIRSVDLLGPLLSQLEVFLGSEVEKSEEGAGSLRSVDEKYFRKIAAIEFAVRYDDGKCLEGLELADIVLVGISRTSKTPLSIFLSHKGLKVANVPLVLNQKLPEELFQIDQKKIIGLRIEIDALRRIRKNRLEKFGQDPEGNYASPSHINQEIQYSEEIFAKNRRWPLINVTDKALEETASEIARIASSRLGLKAEFFF